MTDKLHLLVCKHFYREALEIARLENFTDVTFSPYPDVCMHPQAEIQATLDKLPQSNCGDDEQVMIVGGCFLAGRKNLIADIDPDQLYFMDQCFYLLLNKTLAESYIKSGAYLLTPGWLQEWRAHLQLWGFDKETGQSFFKECAKKLVLLDTKIDNDAMNNLREFAEYLDIPYKHVPVGLDHFRSILLNIVLKWRSTCAYKESTAVISRANRKLADYTMSFDLIGRLTKIMSEDEAVKVIIDIFTMIFGANSIIYAPLIDDIPGEPVSLHPRDDVAAKVNEWYLKLPANENYFADECGYCLRIMYLNESVGLLILEDIPFPQYEDDYVNLSLIIAQLCGLAIANSRTISAREEAEKELLNKSLALARSNEELEQFAYIVSHDLQAPLRHIIGFSGLIMNKSENINETQRDYLERIKQGAANLTELIQALLLYSRVTTRGKAFEPVELDQIVKEIVNDFEQEITELNGKVTCGNLPVVFADKIQMRQLFQNLIGNALKFIHPQIPPEIVIDSHEDDSGNVVITVKDNGIGFNIRYLEKIFLPFQRLHLKDEYPGSGIGLAICRKITHRHGGEITAESEPDQGAVFIITLPVYNANENGE
ncbi:MAG: ATP-binding protein [bacterium]